MKYRILLKFLRAAVYVKRGVWWFGDKIAEAGGALVSRVWRVVVFAQLKMGLVGKNGGRPTAKQLFFKRDVLQLAILALLFFVALPETTLRAKQDPVVVGKQAVAYNLLASSEDYDVEEVVATSVNDVTSISPTWRAGAVENQAAPAGVGETVVNQDVTSIVAGGTAIAKPFIMPGGTAGGVRSGVDEYVIQPGDSLGGIANRFGVSIETILWENNLTIRSLLKPGIALHIPPTSGVMYTVQKRDSLSKIAKNFNAKPEDIIRFNNLKPDGSDLVVGERIMIPGGVKVVASTPATTPTKRNTRTTASSYNAGTPPPSVYAPSSAGFTWPAGVHTITQYYSWHHSGVDIAGPWQTPIYASRDGVVVKSQCGWNGGYGCYIIIDHGDGYRTLYGHNSVLLVSPGETVQAGQTISLMGNTGNVRGTTGIHLHFEVWVNGARTNPLRFVR